MGKDDWRLKLRVVEEARDALAARAGADVAAVRLWLETASLFEQCDMIADWAEDGGITDAKQFRADSPTLDICRGVANGTKHHDLGQHKGYDSDFFRVWAIGYDAVAFTSSTGGGYEIADKAQTPLSGKDVGTCWIQTSKGWYGAVPLADQCVTEWKTKLPK